MLNIFSVNNHAKCVTCTGKMSHNEHIFNMIYDLLESDKNNTELHQFKVDRVSKVSFEKYWVVFWSFQSKIT